MPVQSPSVDVRWRCEACSVCALGGWHLCKKEPGHMDPVTSSCCWHHKGHRGPGPRCQDELSRHCEVRWAECWSGGHSQLQPEAKCPPAPVNPAGPGHLAQSVCQ